MKPASREHDNHVWLREICAGKALYIFARGHCMSPLIEDGARLSVKRRRHYLPGDILVCRSAAGNYQVHRLLGAARWRGRKLLVTRGDNSGRIDGRIQADQVLGKVTGGDCDPRAVTIPLSHRLTALGLFFSFALKRFTLPR